MDAAPQERPSVPREWLTESYELQAKEVWPGRGQHILAQFDDDTIVVYQAYRREIAEYAVRHQRFAGCAHFSESRMTWIKTNFLWMMYRSGWARKSNQDCILAVWLKRDAFDRYLENARTKGSVRDFQGTVRLQWDPDHMPNGDPHPYRRAVQLGLKGVKTYVEGNDITRIADVSEFVREQGRIARDGPVAILVVARERVYVPQSELARTAVALSQNDVGGEREDDGKTRGAKKDKKG